MSTADRNGDFFQEFVVDQLNKLSGQIVTCSKVKGTHGHDIIYRGQPLEVKGISSLFRKDNRTSRFSFNKKHLQQDLAAIAFVIFDKELIPNPQLFLIETQPVFDFLTSYKSNRVSVSLRIVKNWIREGFAINPYAFAQQINSPEDSCQDDKSRRGVHQRSLQPYS